MKESKITLACLGDNKALSARKSVDCIIPLKDRGTLIEQSVILIEQS